MIACLDVDYRDPIAIAACVLIEDWTSASIAREVTATIHSVAAYEPGSFYKRELPCLLAVLAHVSEPIDAVVVDAYVDVAPDHPGLGRHLYNAIQTPVVGVAKTKFLKATHALEMLRGASKHPLFITAADMDATEAAEQVKRMAGAFRVPDALRRVDQLCRTTAG